jgi:hypothetical protein
MRLPTICDACAHKHPEVGVPEDSAPSCDAFPNVIPGDIWFGGFDHRNPHEGDHGVRFVLEPGERNVLELWEEMR